MYHLNFSEIHHPYSPVMICGESNRSIKGPLQVSLCRVHFEQFEQSFGTELRIQTPLERIFGVLLMM